MFSLNITLSNCIMRFEAEAEQSWEIIMVSFANIFQLAITIVQIFLFSFPWQIKWIIDWCFQMFLFHWWDSSATQPNAKISHLNIWNCSVNLSRTCDSGNWFYITGVESTFLFYQFKVVVFCMVGCESKPQLWSHFFLFLRINSMLWLACLPMFFYWLHAFCDNNVQCLGQGQDSTKSSASRKLSILKFGLGWRNRLKASACT